MLQWLIEAEIDNKGEGLDRLPDMMVGLNFASIHTTSMVFIHALYDLTSRPEYVDPLRQEIESSLSSAGGWTHGTLLKMYKLDSFLKESIRCHPLASCTELFAQG